MKTYRPSMQNHRSQVAQQHVWINCDVNESVLSCVERALHEGRLLHIEHPSPDPSEECLLEEEPADKFDPYRTYQYGTMPPRGFL